MPKLDEISMQIGKQQGTLEAMAVEQKRQGQEIAYIRETVTNQRVQMGSMSVTVSLIVSVFVSIITGKYFPGGK